MKRKIKHTHTNMNTQNRKKKKSKSTRISNKKLTQTNKTKKNRTEHSILLYHCEIDCPPPKKKLITVANHFY